MFNWAYIAGFFDGEGNVGMNTNHKYGRSPRLVLGQSGERGLTLLREMREWLMTQGLTVGAIGCETGSKLSTQKFYKIQITNRASAEIFLTNVLPYLHIKKLEAQDLQRTLKIFPALPKGGRLTWESRRGI